MRVLYGKNQRKVTIVDKKYTFLGIAGKFLDKDIYGSLLIWLFVLLIYWLSLILHNENQTTLPLLKLA